MRQRRQPTAADWLVECIIACKCVYAGCTAAPGCARANFTDKLEKAPGVAPLAGGGAAGKKGADGKKGGGEEAYPFPAGTPSSFFVCRASRAMVCSKVVALALGALLLVASAPGE